MSLQISVVGGAAAGSEDLAAAFAVGARLAALGAVLVCGGLGGVMEEACRGARSGGGTTVGILPGSDRSTANPYVDVAVPTGLGELRNGLVVAAGAAVIAVGGGYGTLSEVALALRAAKPVVGVRTWTLVRPSGAADQGIISVDDPAAAADLAVALAADR